MQSLVHRTSAHSSAPRRRRVVIAAALGAALVLIGAVAMASAGKANAGYRTATAMVRNVDQLLHGVATIEPVRQATVAFPVSGSVAGVNVQVGDTVATGAALARLDTASLTAALHQRQAALDAANVNLERALNGETPSTGGSGTSPGGSGGDVTPTAATPRTTATITPVAYDVSTTASATRDATPPTTSPTSASSTWSGDGSTASADGTNDAALNAAQQQVLDAQELVDHDLSRATQALDSASQVCASLTSGASASGSDATTGSNTSGSNTSGSNTSGSSAAGGCADALHAVLTAQQTVAADQTALAKASSALDTLLSQLVSTGTGAATRGTTGTRPSAGSAGSGGATAGSAASGAGRSTSSSPSAAQLVAYQRAVDAAEAQVAVADQALAQATIVSPISGTIAAVNLAAGDAVSGGSSTDTIVVVGSGGYEVTTNVAVADLPKVKVGQAVSVAPDSTHATITGQVVRIGLVGDTSGATTSYPVVIGLTRSGSSLANGATASVDIVTSAATRALAVPTSAVTSEGSRHTVTVLDGDATKTVTVQVGAMGDTWTQVTSGLTNGQRVVLADLGEALPSSATDTSASNGNRLRQGGGFRGGLAGGGGGFPGGGGFAGRTGN